MATGLELGLERLRARQRSLGSDDGGSNDEFVSKLQRDREEFKRDHPLPPLPSGVAGGASKRSHVAPPASPGRPPTGTPAQPPPCHELLVESSDGDVQSYPVVDPALPLRETLLYHELTPGLHLRLDASKSVSDLGLARDAVLQAFAPQVGGGYEDEFEVDMEVEREMEAEQQHRPPRRRRPVESEGEDGAAGEEGSGEAAPRTRRQRVLQVESEDEEPSAGEAEGREEQQEGVVGGVAMLGDPNDDGDVPMAAPTYSFECTLCASEKPMASVVQVDGCNHPDALVCGSCMVTEVFGNAATCPHCRASASALVQVATGRRYEVADTKLSRVDTQGGTLAAPGDDDACHRCHKFGFLIKCDGCEQNRCFKCSGLDWPPEESDPFSCETCARACAEEAEEEEGAEEEEDAEEEEEEVDEGVVEEEDVWEEEDEEEEEEEEEEEADERAGGREARGDAGGAQPAAPADEQQARQTNAQEASARAAKFQEQQRGRVSAPAIAESGMKPWDGVSVEVAQLNEAKVPDFGKVLKTKTGHQTELLPTRHNTLLIEAGCSAEKTRKLIKWLQEMLAIDPDMPVLFLTTRKTHADDLASTLARAELPDFKNYLDTKAAGKAKKEHLSDATRAIVSLESIASVDVGLYKKGVVVMDEVRSLAAIPGGGTLDHTTRLTQSVKVLEMLCSGAEYRVAMDADVSADGAVRVWLRLVAPSFNVLHVQLRKAALKRKIHIGFTASKSRSVQIMKERMKLGLHHARHSRAEAMEGEAGEQLRAAAVAVIRSLMRAVEKGAVEEDMAGLYELPIRKDGGARDAPVEWRTISRGLARRAPRSAEKRDARRSAFADAQSAVCRRVQRVFVITSQPSQADAVVKMADAIGARVAVDEGKYFGKGSDATKRAHFKDTTRAWFWADVVIATSTLSVGVNVRIHFAHSFLYTFPGEKAARLRELLQGIVRVGRDADDPLDDERIFVLISGWPPKLDFDPRPQPARHREILTRMTSKAAESRKAAATAQAAADARLTPVGMPPPEAEEDLSYPLQSLLAWNQLEAEDNAGAQHAIKLVELCKMPTRAWSVHQMEDLPAEEKEELAEFEKELKENGATARLATEDGRVGAMSPAEQYDWLLGELERNVEAKGTTLANEMMTFIAEQEALHSTQQARPEKDCRAQAHEAVYQVVRYFTPTAYDVSAESPWPADGAEYAKLRTCIDQLYRRAMLSAIPLRELEVIHEAQRRQGGTAHAQVKTPLYQLRQLLVHFAEVLGVPIEWLLVPSTFKPTCRPTADGLQSGQCCDACDGSCHECLRWHNRLRAKVDANDAQKRADAERQRRLLTIAQKLGAKVTKQMLPLAIVARVLSDVLALDPPKASEQKVFVEAAQKNVLQVRNKWAVGDAYAERVDAIQLPMLHPETKKLLSVRASAWVYVYERLTGEAVSDAGDFDALLSDAEDEPEDEAMGDAAADSGGGGVAARAFDPKHKTFKADTKRLLALNSTLEAEADAVAATKAAIDGRLGELRNASQGEAGGFAAAFVLLLHPDEPKVLLAREERIERGVRVAKLNPIGGKRAGSETGRATAAREAKEETADRLSSKAQRELRSGTRMTGVWEPSTRSFVYVHRLANPQDVFLPNNVPAGHAGHEQLRGVEWVAVTDLLDPAWRQQHCHSFCHEQVRVAAPLLQGQPDGDVVRAQDTTAQEIQELDALRKDLVRPESLRAVVRGMLARCEGLPADTNGWVELTDAYSYRGTGGRLYVDAAALPRVDGETVLERRTATLQGGHSDLRAVCCGEQAYDIDCENGDPRNLLSLAEQTALSHLVPTWIDYVENREAYLDEICELHGCDASVAKRLPNVVGNGGSWGTWLRDNDLKPPAERSKAFEGKKCKAFLLPEKCRPGEHNATRELAAIRAVLFEHPRFKAMVETERERLVREGLKPRHKHDTSLWSRIMQTSEDTVLSIIDHALFDLGWDVFALVFDGLIAAPSAACAEPDVNKALAAAQAACVRAGWKVVLAEKPLHGLQDEEPKTITKARDAIEAWEALQAAAATDFN